MSVYEFEAIDITGKPRKLSEFKGKVMLIVNTASACGFTPQYEGLQDLYKTYSDDLEILAFPCNQFGAQEKGNSEEIKGFCDLRFNVTFPLFEKIDVNGDNAHPLYQYLKTALPGALGTKKIKWNFTKFLIDRNGAPVKRYGPPVKPDAIEKDVVELIGRN